MTEAILSIAIPTYNRSHALRCLVTSAAMEINRLKLPVEIVISDNASEDDTEEISKRLVSEFSFVRYFKNEENVGGIKNFWLAIERTRTPFAWLMGDDTLIPWFTIDYLVKQLQRWPEIDLLILSGDNKPSAAGGFLFDEWQRFGEIFKTSDKTRLLAEMNLQRLGYISSILVKRSKWLESKYLSFPAYYLYPQIGAILDIIASTDEIFFSHRLCCVSYNLDDNHNHWYLPIAPLSITIEFPNYQLMGKDIGVNRTVKNGFHRSYRRWKLHQALLMACQHPTYSEAYTSVEKAEPSFLVRILLKLIFKSHPLIRPIAQGLFGSRFKNRPKTDIDALFKQN